jgi:hypothetical protein
MGYYQAQAAYKSFELYEEIIISIMLENIKIVAYGMCYVQEIRARKASELAQERADKNLDEVLKRLEDATKERQDAEAEMTRLKEKQLTDELEYTRKLHAQQQAYTEKMLAEKNHETEKMLAVHKEQMEKILAAQDNRPVITFGVPAPGCSIM